MIDAVINGIIYFSLVFIIVYFGFRNIVLRKKLHDEISEKLEAKIKKDIILSEYNDLLQELQNIKLEKSDDFVKFLSDSREWAFTYIEDAQQKIAKFDILLQEIAEWNDTYGTVAGDVPHAEKIKQISLAYNSIRELLPEKPTPNN